MITINTAKEPIRVWIPVLVKEKGSKKMNDLHFPRRVYTKDETFKFQRILSEVIVPYLLDDFLHCYPSIDKCKEFIEKINQDNERPENISEFKYVGIASAVIPQYTQYTKKQKGVFLCTTLEILDKKLDWYKEISTTSSLQTPQQEVFYLVTFVDPEGNEMYAGHKIVPGASQVINSIEEEEIENELEANNYDGDILTSLYLISPSREEAEALMDKVKMDCTIRLRSIRIPECCSIHPTKFNAFLTRGIIPGREILREIIKKPKKNSQKVETSDTLDPLPTTEPGENEVREIKGKNKAEDKKSITEYVGYHSHTLLNPPYLTATSSITCIDSYQKWEKEKDRENYEESGYRDLLVEIADCRGKIRLHNRGGDLDDFINKLVTLREQLNLFINHLEETKDPEEVIQKAKLKFPNRYGEAKI